MADQPPDQFPADQAAWDTVFGRLQREELARATREHPDPVLSLHEGYAILWEEVDELWELVRQRADRRSGAAVLAELVQIAAMAQRIAQDLGCVGQTTHLRPSVWQLAQQRALEIDWHIRRNDVLEREVSVLAADLRHAQARAQLRELRRPTTKRKGGRR